MKKFPVMTLAMMTFFQSATFAAVENFSASGEYLMSDFDTPEIAEQIALDFAKQNAAEQAGIYLEGYSKLQNFNLVEDEIKTVATSKVEVTQKNISREMLSNGRILLRADIQANVNTDELDEFIKMTREMRQTKIQLYKDLQTLNAQIKKDIDNFQAKISLMDEATKEDELVEEQERINREFLSQQMLYNFSQELTKNITDDEIDIEKINKTLNRTNHIQRISDESIKFNPKNYAAYSIRVAMLQRSPQDKLKDYGKAIILNPENSQLYTGRGDLYNSIENYSAAEEDYTTALNLNPKDTLALNHRAQLYLSKFNKYEDAIKDYTKILEIDSTDGMIYVNRAGCYFKMKNYSAAIEDLNKALEIEPKFSFADHRMFAYGSRADVYMEMKEYDKAAEDYKQAVKFASENKTKTIADIMTDIYKERELEALKNKREKLIDKRDKLVEQYVNEALHSRGNDDPNVKEGNSYASQIRNTTDPNAKKNLLNSAIKSYSRAIEENPNNMAAYFQRAKIYNHHFHDYQKAIDDYNKILEIDPNYDYSVYKSRGLAYKSLKEYDKALADYDKALTLKPTDSTIRDIRAELFEETGDYKKAAEEYTEKLKLEPNNPFNYKKRGNMLMELGEYADAYANYNKSYELTTNSKPANDSKKDAETRRNFAENLVVNKSKKDVQNKLLGDFYKYSASMNIAADKNKFYQKALEKYSDAVKLNPKYADAYFERGELYRAKLKDYKNAQEDFTQAITNNPNHTDALYWRGRQFLEMKDYQNAANDFNKCIKVNPNYGKYIYVHRGSTYERQGDLQKAEADYLHAVEIEPTHYTPTESLGNFYMNHGEYQKAVETFTKLMTINKSETPVLLRAHSYRLLKDYNNAVADYTRALDISSKNLLAYFWRGYSYNELKDYKNALKDYNTLIEMNPNYSINSYFNRGYANAFLQNFDAAIADFTKFINTEQKNVNAYIYRAWTYESIGDYKNALADFDKALELDPQNENIKVNRQRILDKMNKG